MTEIVRAIDAIRVGVRHRKELGDLDALVESIERIGLLQPITVTPDGVLVCGWRRLEAVKRLGWTSVKVWIRSGVSDGVAALLAEQDENTLRKSFNAVEQADLYREVKALLAEDAARRKAATQFVPVPDGERLARGGNLPTRTAPTTTGAGKVPGPVDHRTSRHRAAQLVTGKAGYKRLEKIGALQEVAADPEAPEPARQVAVDALERIRTGAPAIPTAEAALASIAALDPRRPSVTAVTAEDLATPAAAAIARVTGVSCAMPDDGGAEPATTETPRRSLWSWVLLWRDLDGWDAHYDPTSVAAGVSDTDWATFERVADAVVAFRDLGRAARAAQRTNSAATDGDVPAEARSAVGQQEPDETAPWAEEPLW